MLSKDAHNYHIEQLLRFINHNGKIWVEKQNRHAACTTFRTANQDW